LTSSDKSEIEIFGALGAPVRPFGLKTSANPLVMNYDSAC